MPKAKEKHRAVYKPPANMGEIIDDIKKLLMTINGMEFSCGKVKKMMLKRAIWLAVELTGNFRCRYRSEGVLSQVGASIQRVHVFPRKSLIKILESDNPDYGDVIEKAQICCIVTMDEHQRLTKVADKLEGWERYEQAGVIWHDMLTYRPG